MKEQYDELTAHLRVVILLIAVLVISLFTFIKTDEKNDYYMDKRLSLYDKIVNFKILNDTPKYTTKVRLCRYYVCSYNESPLENLIYLKDGATVYGDVYYEDQRGCGKIELTDYAEVLSYDTYGIVLLDSDNTELFKYIKNCGHLGKQLSGIDVISDGVFFHEGSLKFTLGNDDVTDDIKIPPLDRESITGELISRKEDNSFRVNFYDFPISEEAKFYQEKVLSKETLPRIKKGIITSYFVFDENFSDIGSEKFRIHLTVVYHPLNMILKEYRITYIVMVLVTIVSLVFVTVARKIGYRKMQSEERLARIMTNKMSYALKEPMISLNESVSDWMNAKEENRGEYADKIITKVDQMDKIIMRLLKSKDVDSKNLNVEFEEVDLYDLAIEVHSIFKPILKKRNIKVSVNTNNPDRCMVKADPDWMKLVIGNLFVNAMDNVDEEFSVLITTGEYEEIEFDIEYKGFTIDNEQVKKIWKDSYVADRTVMNMMGSIGVGLDVLGRVLEANKATYGCRVLPSRNSTMLWFCIKSTS